MADDKAKAAEGTAPAAAAAAPAQKPTLFIILAILNMAVVGGVGAMLYMSKQKEAHKPTIDAVIKGEHEQQKADDEKEEEFIGKLVPLETFVINLAGARGGKLAKINMELEVTNQAVTEEIDKRKPQIRDIIIVLLSGKSYDDISSKIGKDRLRDEIRDTVNSFLSKGQIKNVYFTEFIFT